MVFLSVVVMFGLISDGYGQTAGDRDSDRRFSSSSTIVPDTFLRRWDPVTLFFDQDTGKTGPEDHPENVVQVSPEHPGAYTWLNPRTLQFRPAKPWPALSRFVWRFQNQSFALDTLMSAPVWTVPENGDSDLDPVEMITLAFQEPLDPDTLAEMVTIEIRSLPGVSKNKSQWLTRKDFDIKVMERQNRSDSAAYILMLREPIPDARRVIVRLRLSLSDHADETFQKISFSTAEPFRVVSFGSSYDSYPVTPSGVTYSPQQAISCSSYRNVQIQFSAKPADLDVIQARNLVRFSPAVEDLSFDTYDNVLDVKGSFQSDVLYRLGLHPIELKDEKGRSIQMDAPSYVYIYFDPREDYLAWQKSQGIMERYGPQMFPLEGRGFERVDVRIYPVDPLDRSFWPFPGRPVTVDEDARPPAPGEEPDHFTAAERYITPRELAKQIKAMGSPAFSAIESIPLKKSGNSAHFGLDLRSAFARIAGENKPGTYLVGMRKLDTSTTRSWVRVQVTDLSLTAIEEPRRVGFAVTSLSTGVTIEDAQVRLEGINNGAWKTIFSAKTGADGIVMFTPSLDPDYTVRRIVVSKDDDILVLDPTRPPENYKDNRWLNSSGNWFQWIERDISERGEPAKKLCHIFTERPVYRPDEPVHIKGYFRRLDKGVFYPVTDSGFLIVDGPGDMEWRYPVNFSRMGSFYHGFDEKKLPTGEYSAWIEYGQNRFGTVRFKKEAYRIPRFEVLLHAPDQATVDEAFDVKLTATYYAGGPVVDRPIRWRITQFPLTWAPKKRQGFIYSTDARFSDLQRFESSPVRKTEAKTDADGAGRIRIDSTIEPTAQPRRYVVEATVTGADDQTVTAIRRISIVPPFTLGIKTKRYLKDVRSIEPEIIVAGPDGDLLPGHHVTVRLFQRQWHSHLQAGDFTRSAAKYVTEVVDEKIYETTVESTAEPRKLSLPIEGAGVYIIRIEAADKMGRTQSLSVDLFAGGHEPVTWSRPPSQVFKVTTAKPTYDPGETAVLILESPFQTGRALAVIEPPDERMVYQWVDIRNGTATFDLPVEKSYMPKIPVHFILMRGRVPLDHPLSLDRPDLGKPVTLAATAWVSVSTQKHRVKVDLGYPDRAQPGQEITLTIRLGDESGRPLSGEVTLWLVDQAVLSLGREQRLDPLPDFVVRRKSHVSMKDTRNLTLGHFPLHENPGGDTDLDGSDADLLDRATIRENFKPVAYYDPAVIIGDDGVVSVKVRLPDNLTNFMVRAKAISGADRFGFAVGRLSVRLPVIVQPALPRFVRPGDRFTAAAIARIVEGDGGAGRASIRVDGLDLKGEPVQDFQWHRDRAHRIEYPVSVMTPEYTESGELQRSSVNIVVGVQRTEDQAHDAFSVNIPIRPDRQPVVERSITKVSGKSPLEFSAVTDNIRRGTFRRSLIITGHDALIRMVAGLDHLMEYPHGCTEQRLSRAHAGLAVKRFADMLFQNRKAGSIDRYVNETLEWIEMCRCDNGRVGYWPGSECYVSLTAWTVQFLAEARKAGYPINPNTMDALIHGLKTSLRSDAGAFVDGENWSERVWALLALTDAGYPDSAYGAELARKSQFLNLESKAQVLYSLTQSDGSNLAVVDSLTREIWDGIVFRLHQGREIYGGLKQDALAKNPLILPSETRTLANVIRAISKTAGHENVTIQKSGSDSADKPDSSKGKDSMPDTRMKLRVVVDALVNLGQETGWGSTNADSAAILALTEYFRQPDENEDVSVRVQIGDQTETIAFKEMIRQYTTRQSDKMIIWADENTSPATILAETRFIPAQDGSHVSSASQGFVVTREMLRIKADGAPPERMVLDRPGMKINLAIGDIIEEHIEIVNPRERHFVAVAIPLAAGMEPMNPALATASPEAKPDGRLTQPPSYSEFMDDQTVFYYDRLPKGTYHFYFRTRAVIPGAFTQPAAYAEMMYDQRVRGNSNGAWMTLR